MKNKLSEEQIISANRAEIIKGLIWLGIIVVLIILAFMVFDIEKVQENVDDLGFYGPIFFIIIKISTIVFAPLAGAPLYLLAGPLFGFFEGFIYVLVGDIIGSTIAFYLSRIYGRKILNLFLPFAGRKILDRMLSYLGNWKGIIYVRIIFFAFQDIISYAAGLTKIRYLPFIISSTVAVIIPIGLIIAFGLALVERSTIIYAGAIAVLAALCILLLEIIIKLLRRR